MAKILIIDDEANIRKSLGEILGDEGYAVIGAEDGAKGLQAVAEENPEVVLLDIQMPGEDGLSVLQKIKAREGLTPEVIMISGHGTIEIALDATRKGAFHFLQKPLSLNEVKLNVKNAVQSAEQRKELLRLQRDLGEWREIIGVSAPMKKLREQIKRLAPTTGRVLITGESGSGKEIVARALHHYSTRKTGPFVRLNCAAIPETLIESELFGHEKGAFTGALASKKGKFELAHTGTLFLDEIGDMNLGTQTKLLRVLQEGELERVGGTVLIKVDVRILAATHQDLKKMVELGKFREDLYYRLNVVPLAVPSLRERAEDIPALGRFFLNNFAAKNGRPAKDLSPEAWALLQAHAFPGNVRELENLVERLAIMVDGNPIGAGEVKLFLEPAAAQKDAEYFTRPRALADAKDELEKIYVETQLKLNEWDLDKVSEILGLHKNNLHRKMKQLGIERG